METEKKFNVEIFKFATGKTESIIGKNLRLKKAERRQETGLSRVDIKNFGVRVVEVEK